MDANTIKHRIDALETREALRTLAFAYNRAADSGDIEGLVRLFHPKGIMDSGVIRAVPQEFARKFVRWVEKNTVALSHTICSSCFDVTGDEATGEVAVLALCQMNAAQNGMRVITVGRYHDRYIRQSGRWLFRERVFKPEISWEFPANSDDRS